MNAQKTQIHAATSCSCCSITAGWPSSAWIALMGDRLRLGCAVHEGIGGYGEGGAECARWKSTCKDGLSRMRDFPPSDRSSRQVSPRRVRLLVGRQRAQPRRGGSGSGQTPGWRLLMGSWARASSPDTAALARPLTHRKRLQQRGHFGSRSCFIFKKKKKESPTVVMVPLRQCHTTTTRGGAPMWRPREHQYSNSGQVMGQAIGSPRGLMPLLMSRDHARLLATNSVQDAVLLMCRGSFVVWLRLSTAMIIHQNRPILYNILLSMMCTM